MTYCLIAVPSYNGGSVNSTAIVSAYNNSEDKKLQTFEISSSALTNSFNRCWAIALELKEKAGLTHFLMLHADVRPMDPQWLNQMFEEMDKYEADVVSCIIPIKDHRGLTSTAIDTNQWNPMRITTNQALNKLPETWTSPQLLFNTGLMLIDMRKDWVSQVCFTVNDKLQKNEQGKWVAHFEPEDWNFSRQCHALGLKCFVTRRVRVEHFGSQRFPNTEVWGQAEDLRNVPVDQQSFDIQS